jgi:hypothetical protein
MVAALSSSAFGGNCGQTIEVVGPDGKTVSATIASECSECSGNDIALSVGAYEQVAGTSNPSATPTVNGRSPIFVFEILFCC